MSHPDPPLLSLHFVWHMCVRTSVYQHACIYRGMFMFNGGVCSSNTMKEALYACMTCYYVFACHGEWREHPCVLCVCACAVGKAVVSHPQASIACYHGSHTAGTPPPHVCVCVCVCFFFNLPLFLILFFLHLLLHLLLFFFLSDSQMTPHHHQ